MLKRKKREVNKRGEKAEEELRWVTDSGTVITEEVAEEMAEEIERDGLDLSNCKIVYVGYPLNDALGEELKRRIDP